MIRSSQTFPTSSTYYHLALSFARSGELQDLQQAIANAGLAVEGDSKEVRYWHLLGLLTAATEQWEAAEIALETGATIGEEEVSVVNGSCPPEATQKDPDNELLGVPSPTVNGNGRVIDGLPRTDDDRHPVLNGTEEVPEVQPVYLLGKDDHDIPPASNLLQPRPGSSFTLAARTVRRFITASNDPGRLDRSRRGCRGCFPDASRNFCMDR